MAMTLTEIKERIKNPVNRSAIEAAKRIEELIRFYTSPDYQTFSFSYGANDFTSFLRQVVVNYDQYNLYLSMLQFPVETASLMDKAYGVLWKIFEGKDPVYNVQFSASEIQDDWLNFRKDWEMDRFWNHVSWQQFKYHPGSFIVVDLPKEQVGTRPEPYAYFLHLNKVLDYKMTDNPGEWEELEYIIFRIDSTHIAHFDREAYQVFITKPDSNEVTGEDANIAHGLGICPVVRLMYVKHPVERYLVHLRKLLFAYLGRDITDFSISNPVWWTYEQDCDYSDANGNVCDGGFLRVDGGDYIIDNNRRLKRCPSCHGKFRGHGSVIEIPIPEDGKGIGVPAGVITTPTDALEFSSKRVEERENEILYGLIGTGGDTPNDKAVNEKQVRSIQESTEDKLTELQKTFERAQEKIEGIICRLRYGDDFQSLSVSYGITHFIDRPNDVLSQYNEAREAGASDTILDGIYNNFIQLKYKNNPERLQRENILWNLEPYHHRTVKEVQEMFRSGECEFADFYVKSNFSTLIAKFERENTSVLEFGSNVSFSAKINAIYKELISYGKAIQAARGTATQTI